MRNGTLFLCLFLLIGARSAAAEFGSEKEGFTIRLTGDWKSVSLLSKLLDSETSRLTAFRDLTGKTPLVVHILSTDGFGDLNFNRQAVVDALSKDRQIVGGIRQSTVKIGNCDAGIPSKRGKKDYSVSGSCGEAPLVDPVCWSGEDECGTDSGNRCGCGFIPAPSSSPVMRRSSLRRSPCEEMPSWRKGNRGGF